MSEIKIERRWLDELQLFTNELIGLESGSDIEILFIGVGIIEKSLDYLIRTHLRSKDAKSIDRAYGMAGPLGTFSSRILTARLFGVISDHVAHDIDLIRIVRNKFAHEFALREFSDDRVSGKISNLKIVSSVDMKKELPEAAIEEDGYVQGRKTSFVIMDSNRNVATYTTEFTESSSPRDLFINSVKALYSILSAQFVVAVYSKPE